MAEYVVNSNMFSWNEPHPKEGEDPILRTASYGETITPPDDEGKRGRRSVITRHYDETVPGQPLRRRVRQEPALLTAEEFADRGMTGTLLAPGVTRGGEAEPLAGPPGVVAAEPHPALVEAGVVAAPADPATTVTKEMQDAAQSTDTPQPGSEPTPQPVTETTAVTEPPNGARRARRT